MQYGYALPARLGRVNEHRKSRSYCRTERRKKKTVPIGDGFHEPYGFRKYPGGVFSRKAVADLLGQAINGERKVCATSGSR